MAVMSSQFPLNFKPINLKQTADTWNIRIAFLSVIQTRRHLIHLIIHARPPAVRNGNTALHKVHHTTGMTIFSEQIHVAWLSFRTQNFLSFHVLLLFLWLILYHSPPIFFFLPTFDYNPVSTVTRLRTCKSWFHSREWQDFYLPQSIYSLWRNNSHSDNIIFQVLAKELERFTWSLNEHE